MLRLIDERDLLMEFTLNLGNLFTYLHPTEYSEKNTTIVIMNKVFSEFGLATLDIESIYTTIE